MPLLTGDTRQRPQNMKSLMIKNFGGPYFVKLTCGSPRGSSWHGVPCLKRRLSMAADNWQDRREGEFLFLMPRVPSPV